MEKVKEFSWITCVVKLSGGGFWMRTMSADKVKTLKTFSYNGHKYSFNRDSTFTLHGWQPQLRESRWNAWRMVYNMIYRYFIYHGLLVYEEPSDKLHGVEIPIEPIAWKPVAAEKWTPALVAALNQSKLEETYRKHRRYGNFVVDWKLILIVGVIIVVALLLITGRLPV